MTSSPTNPDFETQVLEHLTQIEKELQRLPQIEQDLEFVKSEFKGWTNWLRTSTTIILFGVALMLIGLVLPIAIGLWRQSLV